MKGYSCNNCQIILRKSPINKTGENLRIAEDKDSESEEEISDEIDDDGIGHCSEIKFILYSVEWRMF
jgi:hypothetical protein